MSSVGLPSQYFSEQVLPISRITAFQRVVYECHVRRQHERMHPIVLCLASLINPLAHLLMISSHEAELPETFVLLGLHADNGWQLALRGAERHDIHLQTFKVKVRVAVVAYRNDCFHV